MLASVRTAIFGLALAASLVFAVGAAQAIVVSGTVGPGDPTRSKTVGNSNPSSCAAPVAFPGTSNDTPQYDAYSFKSTSASTQCVTVSLTAASLNVFLSAYQGSFDPTNAATNFLATSGICRNAPFSFSFNVPAGATFIVVVEECDSDQPPATYTIDVTGTSVILAATFAGASASRTGRGVLVRWRTASEAETLGFNVYRQVRGERVKLNRHLLPARGSIGGASYSYVDRKAPTRRALRYWLQVVDTDGSRTWQGPIRLGASSVT